MSMKVLELAEATQEIQRRINFRKSRNLLIKWLITKLASQDGKTLSARLETTLQKEVPLEGVKICFYGGYNDYGKYKAHLEIEGDGNNVLRFELINYAKSFVYDKTVEGLKNQLFSDKAIETLEIELAAISEVFDIYADIAAKISLLDSHKNIHTAMYLLAQLKENLR